MKLCSGEISFVLQLQTCESQDQPGSKKSLVHQHNLKFLTQAVTPRPRVIKFFHLHHILTTCWSETTLTKIRISPRDMRVGNQVKSLHYFHSYAVHDRIDVSDLSDDQPKKLMTSNLFQLPHLFLQQMIALLSDQTTFFLLQE